MTDEKKFTPTELAIKKLEATEKSLLLQLKHIRKEINEFKNKKTEEEDLKLVEKAFEQAKKNHELQFLFQPHSPCEIDSNLMKFIKDKFEIDSGEIGYRVRTLENSDDEWIIDEEDFENIQDFDLSIYIPLYHNGDKFKEEVNILGTSENLYGIGSINVSAFVLKLKNQKNLTSNQKLN